MQIDLKQASYNNLIYYLDLLLTRDRRNNITTKLYDKRDAFGFHIVNFFFKTPNFNPNVFVKFMPENKKV